MVALFSLRAFHRLMRNVILQVGFSVGYKAMLSVKSLQMGLCADPNRAFAELVMDASNRLLDQHMAQAGAADPRRGHDPANAGRGVLDSGGDASGIRLQLAGEVMTANMDGLQIDLVHVLKDASLLDHKHLGSQPQDVVKRDRGQVVKGLPAPFELKVHFGNFFPRVNLVNAETIRCRLDGCLLGGRMYLH